MLTLEARNWEEFELRLSEIKSQYGTFKREVPGKDQPYTRDNLTLYRGQSNFGWGVLTTLERKGIRDLPAIDYIKMLARIHPELSSHTGKNWALPVGPEVDKWFSEHVDESRLQLPAYDFLVYLRHHGFPSPLLDWTESPYIAAYFAYANAHDHDPAVYCYTAWVGAVRGGMVGEAAIENYGPYVRTHPRHFAQKAWYTLASRWDYQNERHILCSHHDVFQMERTTQDVVVKIKLPASERRAFLRRLEQFNINQYTLFQSEDALVKSMEMRAFDIQNILPKS